MNVLHLCHGLYGNNNGLDTYIRNFLEHSKDSNYIVVPKGKNKSKYKNVIEVRDLNELKEIVEQLDIDILILHWTGQESLKQKNDLVLYKGHLISLSGRSFFEINELNYSPNSFVDVAFLWDDNKKHKTIIISHACYELPSYLNHSVIDAIVHVSHTAHQVNKKIKTNHFVFYPCLDKNLIELHPVRNSKKLRIGWLGRLNKYEPEIYEFIKNKYGHREDLDFIFAGGGYLDNSPPTNFHFKGNITPKKFFSNIDIFLYPTSIDSFSLALLEAMSQSKPCIVSPIVRELAHVGNALVYENQENLLNLLDTMIEFDLLRENLGNNSRMSIIENFSPIKMMRSFDSLFSYLKKDLLTYSL